MSNLRMQEKLELGECIDVNAIGHSIGAGLYVLDRYEDGKDYCDAASELWIWSIGKNKASGKIFAAIDTRFHQNPYHDCLWLR
jgi:hypothetical protein